MSTKEQSTTTQGIIYAKLEDLRTNVPLAKVLDLSAFLNELENRGRIQFSSDETQFAWVICPGTTQPLKSGGTARSMIWCRFEWAMFCRGCHPQKREFNHE